MEIIEVQTEFGPIQFRGTDTGKPILLLITGAFSSEQVMVQLGARFGKVDVLRAHLPGNHCPPLIEASVGVFGAAYGAALDKRFPGRDVVLVGLSVGALVGFAMRSSAVRAIVAIEPPLLMREAWPLVVLREQAPPGQEAFLWTVLGIGPDRVEDRDYRPLISDLRVPTLVLLGDEPPAPGTAWVEMPGLVGPEGRRALHASPRVEVTIIAGAGHHIVRSDPFDVVSAIRHALEIGLGPAQAALTMPPGYVMPPAWSPHTSQARGEPAQ